MSLEAQSSSAKSGRGESQIIGLQPSPSRVITLPLGIVKNGVSSIELSTREEWRPVPVLMVPRLNGTAAFYPDGTITIDVAAATDRWVIIRDLVEFRNVSVDLSVAPFTPRGNFTTPAMRVAASGGLVLGGDTNGLLVEIDGLALGETDELRSLAHSRSVVLVADTSCCTRGAQQTWRRKRAAHVSSCPLASHLTPHNSTHRVRRRVLAAAAPSPPSGKGTA